VHLSGRETWLAVAAAVAVVVLLGDRYVLTPLLESGAAMQAEQQAVASELEGASALFAREGLLLRRWSEMTAGGLAADAAGAESRLLHALRDWAQEEGLELASLTPSRGERDGALREVSVTVSATGRMASVARFLWRVETTTLPLRIRDLTLGSRTEGEDDLSLQLQLSTLYAPSGAAEAGGGTA
jgi:hypothetical protein